MSGKKLKLCAICHGNDIPENLICAGYDEKSGKNGHCLYCHRAGRPTWKCEYDREESSDCESEEDYDEVSDEDENETPRVENGTFLE
jgi:hypothetical protein